MRIPKKNPYSDSLLDVHNKHPHDQIPGNPIHTGRYLELAKFNFSKKHFDILVVEWQSSSQEGKQDDTTAPDIGSSSLVLEAPHNLGRSIVRTTTARFQLPSGWSKRGHTPIGDLEGRGVQRLDQDVLGLQVTVDDRETVRIVESIDDLFKERQCFEWGEPPTVDQEVEEFSTFDVLEDEVEFPLAFIDVVNSHDVRMVHELHHCNLPIDTQPLFFALCLLSSEGTTRVEEGLEGKYLDRSVLACAAMTSDLDVPACAFPDTFANDPGSDKLGIVRKVKSAPPRGFFLLLPTGWDTRFVQSRCARRSIRI